MARVPVPHRPALAPGRIALFSALTTLCGVAAIAGAAELGARAALGDEFVPGLPMGRAVESTSTFDPELGWKNRAGVRTEVVAPSFRYRVSINSKGLRDREHDYAKPDGVFRVALLGDSLGWGWGVDDGLSFADRVEAELGPDVEVINLSVPGYGTDQELWTLEREGRKYDPDLVLLCFILNDVPDNATSAGHFQDKPRWVRDESGEWVVTGRPVPAPRAGTEASRGRTPLERLYASSALFKLLFPADSEQELAQRGRAVLDTRPVPDVTSDRAKRRLATFEEETRELCAEVSREGSVTRMLLGRLAVECETLGVPLVAFSIAHHHDRYLYAPSFPPPKWIRSAVDAGRGVAGFRTVLSVELAKVAEAEGFHCFSVDEAMLASVLAGHTLHCGDGHLNELGNRIVAERIVEELRPLLPERLRR